MWNRKHFLWNYVFFSQMRHLCGSLCILVYKKCWRWQFLLKIVEEYGWNFYTDLKIIIMCFVEPKICFVILRIFLTNAPPLWFPLYSGLQKCWRWQFLLKIVEEYGYNFYTDLKGAIMCFAVQKTFSVI